jgi:hypothetical protein
MSKLIFPDWRVRQSRAPSTTRRIRGRCPRASPVRPWLSLPALPPRRCVRNAPAPAWTARKLRLSQKAPSVSNLDMRPPSPRAEDEVSQRVSLHRARSSGLMTWRGCLCPFRSCRLHRPHSQSPRVPPPHHTGSLPQWCWRRLFPQRARGFRLPAMGGSGRRGVSVGWGRRRGRLKRGSACWGRKGHKGAMMVVLGSRQQ